MTRRDSAHEAPQNVTERIGRRIIPRRDRNERFRGREARAKGFIPRHGLLFRL